MATTYEKIASTTVSGSATNQVQINSLPSTYTDLRVVVIGTSTVSGYDCWMRFNSDTGTNYSYTYLSGQGTGGSSARTTAADKINLSVAQGSFDSTNPVLLTADIFSYAGSTNKTTLATKSADLNGSGATGVAVYLWRNTAAITSLTFNSETGGTFKIGSTFTVYGILKA